MIGTKNSNQMITDKNFGIALSVCIVIYFASDIFFNDAVLYLVGGLFGGLSKTIGLKGFAFLIWAVFLVSAVVLSFKIESKVFWFIILAVIWFLLYLIDVFFYKLLPDITSKSLSYLHLGLSVLLKSTALAWIYYAARWPKVF